MNGPGPLVVNPSSALDIVTDPENFYTVPTVLGWAWEELMRARGCRVDLDRLDNPAHLVGRPCDLRNRIHTRARAIGITGPTPLVLRDATPKART